MSYPPHPSQQPPWQPNPGQGPSGQFPPMGGAAGQHPQRGAMPPYQPQPPYPPQSAFMSYAPATRKRKKKAPLVFGIIGALLLVCLTGAVLGANGDDATTVAADDPVAVASNETIQATGAAEPKASTPKTAVPVVAGGSYDDLTDRSWLQIVKKDPDAHANDRVVIYGIIQQFDAATGNELFLAVAGLPSTRADQTRVPFSLASRASWPTLCRVTSFGRRLSSWGHTTMTPKKAAMRQFRNSKSLRLRRSDRQVGWCQGSRWRRASYADIERHMHRELREGNLDGV